MNTRRHANFVPPCTLLAPVAKRSRLLSAAAGGSGCIMPANNGLFAAVIDRSSAMRDSRGLLLPVVLCLAALGGALGLAAQDSPEDLARRYRAYQALVREASAAIERAQYEAAVEACTKAIALSPFTASHYFYRGLARYRQGRPEEALGDFDR